MDQNDNFSRYNWLSCIQPSFFGSNLWSSIFLPPSTKLGQGIIFRSMCQEFCLQGEGACVAGGRAWQGEHSWWGRAWQGGMHGRGHVWQGACIAGSVHGSGMYVARGACVAGGRGMCGRGHTWQGACMTGDLVAYDQWAGGMHPTGMHSFFVCLI